MAQASMDVTMKLRGVTLNLEIKGPEEAFMEMMQAMATAPPPPPPPQHADLFAMFGVPGAVPAAAAAGPRRSTRPSTAVKKEK